MKKLLILLICIAFTKGLKSQIATDPRTEEYATVRAVVSALTGSFSSSSASANPVLEMEGGSMELKDFVKDPKGAKFESVSEMINYMNKFSWALLNLNTVKVEGSKTNDIIMYYTFKRKPKTK